ncbi:hypothetical protein EHI8A_089530 [Entamoeba histolytica HM-1:IMSS-B]|uniref:Uncharacterized protein n=8 Tax=Entamoeba TaxID=5758 RepID=C4LUK3_ENTH1|nr:hypothetical protein ENU1_002890 [Entamoeba nuttalli P19]XP_653484.1 hypothetical protein EHI_022900 [Entamoeba histolytica HM-1:IMSS]EMD46485.1 Hypothetical protein EHI5A_127450 [Entamoeba histolytica KU27]EMH75935.1 hypothetical protein EHI8A_089530 [Entamoeba histolytica HM-1:IMSS-B]EMS11206.1 hypothetical protein KM1_083700 [Entamoeba histolytica HM-3:IMSS]ENY62476.1 hypothetical protein EHI7A_087650 [Entamoeba histolytica HM-1:IMSS-A]GAT92300.1 hypothetical protein CL6EHI_022900 [Enta|eukprot:XP_008854692.1 hypothetical protein ENU1_002890 [Entamoeba nuttalli P19]
MVKITCNCVLTVIFAFILPPVSMYLMEKCEKRFWISLILTLLFFLPGQIYTIFYMVTHPTELYAPGLM